MDRRARPTAKADGCACPLGHAWHCAPGRRQDGARTAAVHHGDGVSSSIGGSEASVAGNWPAVRATSAKSRRLATCPSGTIQVISGAAASRPSRDGSQRAGSFARAAAAAGPSTSVGTSSVTALRPRIGTPPLGRAVAVANSRRSTSGGSRSSDSARIAYPAARSRPRRSSARGRVVSQSPGVGRASVRKGKHPVGTAVRRP